MASKVRNKQKMSNKKRRGRFTKGRPLPPKDYRIYDNRFGGMPDSFETILEYTDVVKISSVSAGSAGYIFRGNSLYDPDYTSTGHQPRYFDQNMTIYTRYHVVSAQVTLYALGETALFLVMVPTTDPLTFTTGVAEQAELPRARVIAVGGSYVMPSKAVTALYTTQGVLGLSSVQVQDLSYSGDVSSNPSSLWYINLSVFGPIGSTSVSAHVHVHISYKCVFFDRLTVTSSYSAPAPSVKAPPSSSFKIPGIPTIQR